MIQLRPATQADWLAWHDSLPPSRVRAWVIDDDGASLALGGVKYGGPCDIPCVFFALKDDARARKKTLHKFARIAIAHVLERESQVVAIRDEKEPTADRWLRRLGFEPLCMTPDGEYYHLGRR